MENVFNISDQDIDLFITSYEKNLLVMPVMDHKIPNYIELLKHIKYYREIGMEFDDVFLKRFGFSNDDYIKLSKLIERVKRGKSLYHRELNKSYSAYNGNNNFAAFDENEDYSKKPKFELLSQVEGSIDAYYEKMGKLQKKRDVRQNEKRLQQQLIDESNNRYYNSGGTSQGIDFDHLAFSRGKLANTNLSDSINDLSYIDDLYNSGQIGGPVFDQDFKQSYAHNTRTKMEQSNKRFFDEVSIMQSGPLTRHKSIKNRQPFENQFQYNDNTMLNTSFYRMPQVLPRSENRQRS